ncbi:MAG: formylglycine-generating enzyme family protein [Planctomycetota bacterium]
MKRLFCLVLAATLASSFPIVAQDTKTPPKEFTNSIGMKFAWIPPGNFVMGSPKEEEYRLNNETQHKVALTKGFYMGVYTVTQEQWETIMGDNPSVYRGEKGFNPAGDPFPARSKKDKDKDKKNLPVENVSWADCQEFNKKLKEKDKKPYRLPTEAEWEYACRAGTTTPYHFGETITTEQANFNGKPKNFTGRSPGKSTPVGSFPANAFGLYDMHGNVWQWCQDWYGPYPRNDAIDPQGPESGKQRVLRGCHWFFGPGNCRSAYRHMYDPDRRNAHCSFRVCFFLD